METEGRLAGEGPTINADFQPDARIVLYHGDAEAFVQNLPDQSISLVITSPPYNLGKDYEERLPIGTYLKSHEPLIDELIRVLADNGSICWQVGNSIQDGEVFPLDCYYYPIFKERGLRLRNRIVWRYGHGLHAEKRFSGRYETILWFTKSDKYIFNLDQVRMPSKYPGKRYSRGPKKGQPSGNSKGKNPSDYWEVVEKDWDEGIWNIPNVKASHLEKTSHPCQYPVELVERCVLALSNEDDWVLDPFVGVGSSLIGAIKHNRRAIGCEKVRSYVDIAQQRIYDFLTGNLRTRPLNRPVLEPELTTRVAKIPDEWKDAPGSIYFGQSQE